MWELLGESAAATEDESGNCSRAASATSTKAGTTNRNDGQERGEPNRIDAGALGPGLAAAVEEDGVDDVVSLAASSDVADLGAWLHRAYTRRLAQPGARDDAGRERSSVLLTGPPAAGKTCLKKNSPPSSARRRCLCVCVCMRARARARVRVYVCA